MRTAWHLRQNEVKFGKWGFNHLFSNTQYIIDLQGANFLQIKDEVALEQTDREVERGYFHKTTDVKA